MAQPMAHTESHSAPTPSERVTGRLAVRLALQAVENRDQYIDPGFPASDAATDFADQKKRATEIFPDNSI